MNFFNKLFSVLNSMLIVLITSMSLGCTTNASTVQDFKDIQESKPIKAKFEPEDGKVLMFVGQELEAVGGVPGFQNGYLDHFRKPAGWTAYTSFNGDLQGVWETGSWGDGYSNMSLQLQHFDDMALAIGIDFVNQEESLASGLMDDTILRLGNFLKNLGTRPVFLRIGYEFDGHDWNHYDRLNYIKGFRRVKDKFDSLKVENVAFVWQSTGWASNLDMLEQWYPGDEYVDWCGFSFFSRWDEQRMIEFARAKGKPVLLLRQVRQFLILQSSLMGRLKKLFCQILIKLRRLGGNGFYRFSRLLTKILMLSRQSATLIATGKITICGKATQPSVR